MNTLSKLFVTIETAEQTKCLAKSGNEYYPVPIVCPKTNIIEVLHISVSLFLVSVCQYINENSAGK